MKKTLCLIWPGDLPTPISEIHVRATNGNSCSSSKVLKTVVEFFGLNIKLTKNGPKLLHESRGLPRIVDREDMILDNLQIAKENLDIASTEAEDVRKELRIKELAVQEAWRKVQEASLSVSQKLPIISQEDFENLVAERMSTL